MVAVGELWETLKHSITAYTGLSPAAFFTVLAVAVAFYHVVSGFFQPPPRPPPRKREAEGEAVEPLPPPVQLGEITEEELRAYDGSDPKKPLLMAIKGQIYDVTQSRLFYGPGGPYALFAGKDASRALAKMSFETKDLTGDISGLGPFELEALQDWEYRFMGKYVKVGTIKTLDPVTEGGAGDPTETSEITDASHTDRQVDLAAEQTENGPTSHEHGETTQKKEDPAAEQTENGPTSYEDGETTQKKEVESVELEEEVEASKES